MRVIIIASTLLLTGCVSNGMPINTAMLGSGLNNAINYGANSYPQPQEMQTYDATITRLYAQRLVGYGPDSQPWTMIQGDTFRMAPLLQEMGYAY